MLREGNFDAIESPLELSGSSDCNCMSVRLWVKSFHCD